MSEAILTHTEVVETYAKGVGAGDLKLLRSIFADDMELVGYPNKDIPTGRLWGGDAIAEFFGKLLEARGGAEPHPGPLMVVGNRVAVEIEAHHGDEIYEMCDFFTIENGEITRLAVYQGPIRKKSA